MTRDSATTQRLQRIIDQITSLTETRALRWERQSASAHRYARWNDHLLILGPATPLSESNVTRYLVITPFDSPEYIEINSDDAELGQAVMKLVQDVEATTQNQPATDPFAFSPELLTRLEF